MHPERKTEPCQFPDRHFPSDPHPAYIIEPDAVKNQITGDTGRTETKTVPRHGTDARKNRMADHIPPKNGKTGCRNHHI